MYAWSDISLPVTHDSRSLAQRGDPLSRRGGRSSAVPRGRCCRYVFVVCHSICISFRPPISTLLADRRVALLTILKSMLVTYSSFLGALLAPPPSTSSSDAPPEWHRQVEWITVLAQNIMAAANDLRPVQVRSIPSMPLTNNAVYRAWRELRLSLSGTCEP